MHGYPHDAFLALLERAGFSDTDFLYILGDVIDRNGDGGVRTLVWLLSRANVQLLLGNHEAMLLSCRFIFDEITKDSINALSPEKMQILNTWTNVDAGAGFGEKPVLYRLDDEKEFV
ncbi:MAG: metallophosphoesterase [Eubacterium sp.]|nr:metallophosphoesterase [Eubacterium sp.]